MEALRTAVETADADIRAETEAEAEAGPETPAPTEARREAQAEPEAATAAVAEAGTGAASGPAAGRSTRTGRVGVVLVSHSAAVAAAVADLSGALLGSLEAGPLAVAGGTQDGGTGTSAALILAAVHQVDEGQGVAVLCDMGSAVLTMKSLLADEQAPLPAGTRIVDAPFLEGAVAVTLTSALGGDLDAVLSAAEDARHYRKR
nr:PTS fructose transporter subunit IIA [Streptomyces xanthophaeus]